VRRGVSYRALAHFVARVLPCAEPFCGARWRRSPPGSYRARRRFLPRAGAFCGARPTVRSLVSYRARCRFLWRAPEPAGNQPGLNLKRRLVNSP